MKKFIAWVVGAAFFFVCFCLPIINSAKMGKSTPHCPVCDATAEYEIDREDVREWLEDKGYVVADPEWGEDQELAWNFFVNDPDQLEDLVKDYGIDCLEDMGYTVIAPVSQNSRTTQMTTAALETQGLIVYWVPRGYAYHSTKSCPSLSRSTVIFSGTIEEATAAGKGWPCERCWD